MTTLKQKITKKTTIAPTLLCQLLSPYSSKSQVEDILLKLLADDELLDLTIELANSRFMIATLYTQLKIHGVEGLLAEELIAYLSEITAFMKIRGQSLVDLVEEIVTISNQNDITPLLIKGSSTLFSDVYPEKSIRFMSDLDILYKEKDVLTIFKLLQNNKFAIPKKYLPDVEPLYLKESSSIADLPLSQHLLPIYRKGDPCSVEIHFRPLNNAYKQYMDCGSAFASSSAIDELLEKGLSAQRMTPENEVIHCFVHSQIAHGFHNRYYLDILQMDFFVRLIHHHEQKLDWNNIHLRIKQAGGEGIFQHYLYAVNQLFATNYPLNDSGVVQENSLEEHYHASLGSCFPAHHLKWRIKQFIEETSSVLSQEKICKLYTVDSAVSLLKARIHYMGVLISKYGRPLAFMRRLKYSFRMFS